MTDTTPFAAWLAEWMRLAEAVADAATDYGRDREEARLMGVPSSALDRAEVDAARTALRAHLARVPMGTPLAWALLTNGKPHAPKVRSLSVHAPSTDSLQIAEIERETWAPLYTKPEGME